jgi:hypothetical protein
MKNFRSMLLFLLLLFFCLGTQQCSLKKTEYCQNASSKVQCNKPNLIPENIPAGIFPGDDLIIKI